MMMMMMMVVVGYYYKTSTPIISIGIIIAPMAWLVCTIRRLAQFTLDFGYWF